ncbi:MAG: saccharopine dehydrogenase family protein [Planctomycetota bacterium]|jgi:saccharopine dehydrogenase (NADP+, L-glutamate forming)
MPNTIHWLGAGLSSPPGILRLDAGPNPVIVWNRTLEQARRTLNPLKEGMDIRQLDWEELEKNVAEGDVVVSMLPATLHLRVAEMCLKLNSHFVSSSYISPEMSELDDRAKSSGVCLVNEVGLDPGLDHLLAHSLIDQYTTSEAFSTDNAHSFRSYCGGFPKIPNDFRYKFSWSPLGVLRALKSPAQWVSQGQTKTSQAPWHALTRYTARFPGGGETFEAFANRDSVPFMKQYNFGEEWNVEEFVRGTLRLDGWSTAWKSIFDEMEDLSGDDAQKRLAELSAELEKKYSYDEGEPDRVVLCVELEAKKDGNTVWHRSYQLDACGNEGGQAMARLVSLHVSLAVESTLKGEIALGVSAAPDRPELVNKWLAILNDLGEEITIS